MDLQAIMGVNNSLASAFSVYVRNELAKSYQVLSLEDMKAVSGWVEARLKVGCDDTKCLIELGGAMGTDLVVAGSISKIANTYGITLRLINTRGKDAGVSKRAISSSGDLTPNSQVTYCYETHQKNPQIVDASERM